MTKQLLKWTAIVSVFAALAATSAFGQKVKSKKESEAIMAIQNATTADARLAAIENLLTNFVDTEFKIVVLEMAIDTARSKNDAITTQLYCERTLEADPKDLDALSTLAIATAKPIRENDLDKDDKLKRVDELTGQCLKILPDAKKPTAMYSDEIWASRKNDFSADCHGAVAAAALVRKKPDVAATEYEAALAARKDPADMVRLAQVYNMMQRYDDALAQVEKVNAVPDLHPAIKSAAGREKVAAMMGKQKAAAAKPPAEAPKPQQ